MYDFYVYDGKDDSSQNTTYRGLQKSAQVVGRLAETIPRNIGHKLFFDSWFTTLDLIHYLDRERILSVGIIRSNRLQGCPLVANKDLQKQPKGSFDCKTDNNSGICIVKRNDKSIVQLTSNFVATDPIKMFFVGTNLPIHGKSNVPI